MKTIHVNRYNIEKNEKEGRNLPVIAVQIEGEEIKAHEVVIYGQDGKEAARVKYNSRKPLNRTVKVWIETDNKIEIL